MLLFFSCWTVIFFSFGKAYATPVSEIKTYTVSDSLPVPKGIKNLLFYLQLFTDANTVIYELNSTETDQIIDSDPVSVYWIRYAEGGEKEELSLIQQKFAYGIMVSKLRPGNYELRLVSYPKFPLYLMRGSDGQYQVYAKINGKSALLKRIYISVDGGSMWSPNIEYIELSGVDVASNKNISYKIRNP